MGLLDVILGRDLGMPEWMKEEIEKEQPEPSVSPTQRSAVLEWLRQMGGQEGPNVSPAPGRPASREREEALYGPDPARLLAEQQAELARQAPQVQPPQPQIAPTPQAAAPNIPLPDINQSGDQENLTLEERARQRAGMLPEGSAGQPERPQTNIPLHEERARERAGMTEGGAGALAGLSQIPQATEDGGGTMAMLKKILPYLAAGGAVGLGAKLGGKDFMRGLGSGLQDLGPNMARARQEKEKRAHELAKLAPGEERDQASFEQELADSQAEALSQMGSKGLARQRDALIGQYGENVVDRAFNMAEEREAKAGREERQTAADELRAGASVTGAETGKLTAENRQEHLRQQREKAERDAGKPTFKVVSGELVKIDPDGTTETVKKKLISRTDAADMLMVYEEFIKEPLTERDGQDLLYPEDEDRQTESDYRRALLASEIARMREIVGAQDVPDEEAAHRKKLEDSEWIFNQGP